MNWMSAGTLWLGSYLITINESLLSLFYSMLLISLWLGRFILSSFICIEELYAVFMSFLSRGHDGGMDAAMMSVIF